MPTYKGDFFPYTDKGQLTWTGYFSTRPNLKRMVREISSQYYAFSELATLENIREGSLLSPEITQIHNELRDILAIMSHHDAITGTSKQHVIYDYVMRM